jgi:hypothetical protein
MTAKIRLMTTEPAGQSVVRSGHLFLSVVGRQSEPSGKILIKAGLSLYEGSLLRELPTLLPCFWIFTLSAPVEFRGEFCLVKDDSYRALTDNNQSRQSTKSSIQCLFGSCLISSCPTEWDKIKYVQGFL